MVWLGARREWLSCYRWNDSKQPQHQCTSNIVCPAPAIAEQSRIAGVLDTVDMIVAKTQAVIAKLRQVRAGLLQDLLTRDIGKTANSGAPSPTPINSNPPQSAKSRSRGRVKTWGRVYPLRSLTESCGLGLTLSMVCPISAPAT